MIFFYRVGEEKVLYMCGLMETEVKMMMIVLLMDIPQVSTPYLLVQCLSMGTTAHMMNHAQQK